MSLSSGEIELVRSVWPHLVPGMKDHGHEVFIQFFQRNPSSMDRFKHFKGKDVEQIRDSKSLNAHGVSFVSKIGQFIQYLDDPDTLDGLAEKFAEYHLDLKIPRSEYDIAVDVILQYLQSTLSKDIWTDDASAAWKKMLATVMDAVEKWTTQLQG